MPRESLFFSPKRTIFPPPPSSSPSRFGFSPARPTFSESVMDRSLDAAEPIIMKWNPDTTTSARVTSLFHENRREAHEFIRSVGILQRALLLMAAERSTFPSDKTIRAQNLMKSAMKRLQKEFYQILSMNRANLDSESVSIRSSRTSTASSLSTSDNEDDEDEDEDGARNESISKAEDASTNAMADLRLIAECMISSGYAEECTKIYKIIRKSVVDEGIFKLGLEKFTSRQIQKMEWEALNLRIHNWITAVRIALQTLFNGERILCDFVFASSDSNREACFTELIKDGAMILFEFPEIVAKTRKKIAPEIFGALDMYAGISNHWQEIDSIFSSKSTNSIRSQAINSLIKLGEFIRAAVDDFESSVRKYSSKTIVAGAGIHPLTIDAMDYLIHLIEYINILSDILANSPTQSKNSSPGNHLEYFDGNESPVSAKIAWLILGLLCKLDTKGKYYKHDSLSYLFLANNLQYIVTKVRTSNLTHILGSDWVTKHEEMIKRYASKYERLGWSHVVELLSLRVSEPGKIKGIFQKFNSAFDQAYRKQSGCVVPDKKLRDYIKTRISENIFQPYRQFYISNLKRVENARYLAPIVRYAPDDVANRLSDLFFDIIEPGS